MHTPPRILVVEDDDLQYEIYEEALSKDYELVRVTSGSQALESIPKTQPDLIVLDHILDLGDLGLDYLPEFKELLPFVPIILVSGALEVQQQMEQAQYVLPIVIHVVQPPVTSSVLSVLD